MSRKYQNLVGALAWIASRDAEAADDLNDRWNEVESQLDRVVVAVQLNHFATAKGVEKAKSELVAACEDGRLIALGHTERNEETRPIPETAWIRSNVDEVEGGIGKDRLGWHGLRFKTADLRKLWKESSPSLSERPSRKKTGPQPNHREAIARILERHRLQEEKAMSLGELPPPRPTSAQIAKKLKMSERTVRHNVSAILSGKDGEASAQTR